MEARGRRDRHRGARADRADQGFCNVSGTVIVSQLGARMHYAVPRIFARAGSLETLYTDICATKGWPRLLRHLPRPLQPGAIRRLNGRIPRDVPAERIVTFPEMGAWYVARRMQARTRGEETRLALDEAHAFSARVAASGFGAASGLYGIAGECLGQLEAARRQGLWTAVEQIIAPRMMVDRLVAREIERFPDWGMRKDDDPFGELFADQERAEWAVADCIVCPSTFVRDGVVAAGGPPEKCVVVPYGIEIDAGSSRPARTGDDGGRRLRVLTVGAVGLRKGAPYVLEAAWRCADFADFRMAGPIQVSARAASQLRGAVDLRGIVPRAEIAEHYAWADVFLLPTVCEGSATVTYEALLAGLPVITTPNAGSVVEGGLDGLILPLGDVGGITRGLRALHANRDRLAAMSMAAKRKARQHSIEAYGERLMAALEPLRAGQPRPEGPGARSAATPIPSAGQARPGPIAAS
jgi:glycosyltransferase involved in cell wall biosynthesis